MQAKLEARGIDQVLSLLEKLPAEVTKGPKSPVRVAHRKGLNIIVRKAKENFRRAVAEVGKTGITDTTGFTESKIFGRRKRPPGGAAGEYGVVTVRGVPHPSGHTFRGRPIQANDIAFIMEAGTEKQDATPWLRPTVGHIGQQVIDTVSRDLVTGVELAAAKYLRGTTR